MTLEQWEMKYDKLSRLAPNGAKWVLDKFNNPHERAKLWDLEDYIVSSVQGGVIWLVRKE